MPPPTRSPGLLLRSALLRVPLFALLWWGLVEGEVRQAHWAAVAVGAGVAASFVLVPPERSRGRWRGLARFVPYFLWQSVQAGADVAWRALHPRLPIDPGFIEYPLELSGEDERVFFTDALSLLPGTLGVELRRDSVRIHVLNRAVPVQDRLRELEEYVAGLFGRGRG